MIASFLNARLAKFADRENSKNLEFENSKIAKSDRANSQKLISDRAGKWHLSPTRWPEGAQPWVQCMYRPRLAVGFRHPAGIVHTQR
ncbi:MAG: hypothetical protein WB760_04210 [Xanthobacteraceae bacterium]